ncbi:Glycoside hydrolase, 38 vacuolar alpha mannosidase [Marasmius tenuissimus]|uniref:Glycoside hydrolase, 38 vacuolar alpha mannosidase n=1 Tax=Marasmius tenuissimus TaxID=585030 RepID=A0ABR2ZQN9_9AGAR
MAKVDGAPNVFVETIKRGEYDTYEDSEDSSSKPTVSVVLRLYEAYGGRAQALLKLGYAEDIDKVYLANLMEDEENKLGLVETDEKDIPGAKLGFHGFEVKTVKIVLKSSRFVKGGEWVLFVEVYQRVLSTLCDGKRSSWVDVDSAQLTSGTL